MCHNLPFPLSPRVFPLLVVTAKTGPLSFLVVQIPVNLNSLQEAFYSSGRNSKEGDTEVKRKRIVMGYVAVSLYGSLVLQAYSSVEPIPALSVAGSLKTRALNGPWLQPAMQKSWCLSGHKSWGLLQLW